MSKWNIIMVLNTSSISSANPLLLLYSSPGALTAEELELALVSSR